MTELLLARSAKEVGDVLLENLLFLTILIIFCSALLTIFLKSRSRDKCLKDFEGYPVTLEDRNKKVVWGSLRCFSSGFELRYEEEYKDPAGHYETSYIVYESEYPGLQALYRFHELMSASQQQRRRLQIDRTYRPSLLRRFGRKVGNFFATLRDAFVSSVDAWISQSKKGSALLKTQGGRVSEMGKGVIGHFGNSYDSILERFIGKRVVVEVEEGGKVEEFPGILKEYTATYLELLKVEIPRSFSFHIREGKSFPMPGVQVERSGNDVTIRNRGSGSLRALRLISEEWEESLAEALPSGEDRKFAMKNGNESDPTLQLQILQDFDAILPRQYAAVRHAGRRDSVDWRSYLWGGSASSES